MTEERVKLGPRVSQVPEGDNVERMVCPDCGFIQYDNPKVVVGAVVTWQEKILLCKRSIHPRKGYWTIPAGYLELQETPLDGAKREAMEEANADLDIDRVLAVYCIPRLSQIQILYRATLIGGYHRAGPESQKTALYDWDDIPWVDLAFPSVKWVLNQHREVIGKADFAPFSNPEGETGDYDRAKPIA